MTFIASDVMDGARMMLNDTAATLYSNTAITPHVIAANEQLELEMLALGISVVRKPTTAIVVAANALTLNLPSDFLLPLELFERASGNVNDPWVPVTEKTWVPADYVQTTSLTYWAFYNNAINFPGATVARDVMLRYERQLAVVTGPNSPEENIIFKRYLSAKTAEYAARYVGMNKTISDDIHAAEVRPALELVTQILVGNMQGNPVRRQGFNTQRRVNVLR